MVIIIMKNRTEAYNSIYLPYIEKHLGGKVLQNILVTGAHGGGIGNEPKGNTFNPKQVYNCLTTGDQFPGYIKNAIQVKEKSFRFQ